MQRSSVRNTLIVSLAAAALACGQSPFGRPSVLQNVGIDQKLNTQIPVNLQFTDETGQRVALSRYFGKPVVLALVYYQCPSLCNLILEGMLKTFKHVELDAGKDFNIVAVSFDPREKFELAAAKKQRFVEAYDRPSGSQGWHFLTDLNGSSKALADAVGFHYAFDKSTGQFAHASTIIVLTPQGRVAQYFYGIKYPERDVRLSLVGASKEKIGSVTDQILLFCYHYDPAKGKYTLAIMNVLRAAGLSTVLALGVFLTVMLRRDRSASLHGGGPQGPAAGGTA